MVRTDTARLAAAWRGTAGGGAVTQFGRERPYLEEGEREEREAARERDGRLEDEIGVREDVEVTGHGSVDPAAALRQ